MLPAIVFNDSLWSALAHLPLFLAFVAGALLMAGWLGTRGWEPRCRRCGQELAHQQTASECPECGANLSQRGSVRTGHRVVCVGRLVAGLAFVALAVVTAVPTLFTPGWMRLTLGRWVSTEAILAAIDAQPKASYPNGLLQDRIRSADPAVADAIATNVVDSVRTNGQLSPAALKGLDEGVRASLLTDVQHARIAEALVEGVRKGTFSLQSVNRLRPLMIGNGSAISEYTKAFLACDECIEQTVSVQVAPATAPVGTTLSVAVRSSEATLSWLKDAEVAIRKIQIRARGEDAWRDVTSDNRIAQPSLKLRAFGTIEGENFGAAGDYELAVQGNVELGGDPPRAVPFRRTLSVTITSRDSIVATPVRGNEAREEVAPTLRSITFEVAKQGDTLSMLPQLSSLGRVRGSRKGQQSECQVIGSLSIVQGEHAWVIGDLALHRSGFGFGGSGEIPVARESNDGFDEAKPFVVRFTPEPSKQKAVATSSFLYLDEPFDLRFPSANLPPTELIWTREEK